MWTKGLHELVGKRVQRLRRRESPTSLTQQGLAERTKGALSRSSIASLERGLQGVSLVQLYVLAQALEVEPSELLPSKSEVLLPERKVESLLKGAPPKDADFISKVRETSSVKKGGRNA